MWALFSASLLSCTKISIESPPQDSVFKSEPWIPISIWFNKQTGHPESVSLKLDGNDWVDPHALIRRRWDGRGGGFDYLGYLDLYTIPNGEHQLSITATLESGRKVRRKTSFSIQRPSSKIEILVTDEQGNPVDGRVTIYQDDQRYPLIANNYADHSERDQTVSTIMTQSGYGELYLPAGSYQLIIFRGFQDNIVVENISLASEQTKEIRATISTAISTEGWSTADFHVHTARSADAFVPNFIRYQSLLVSNLDAVVITEHNQIEDIDSVLSTFRHEHHHTIAIPGNEASMGFYNEEETFRSIGHYNAFPLAPAEDAAIPTKIPDPPAQVIDDYRRRQIQTPFEGYLDDVALQLNHPRGIQFFPEHDIIKGAHALFTAKGFDSSKPVTEEKNSWLLDSMPSTGTTLLDFDAMEIVNRFSWPLYKRVRKDWFALLNQGHHITGTGNSDSHSLEVEQIGFPANFVPCPSSNGDPSSYDMACLVESVQQGTLYVSNGPIIHFGIEHGQENAIMGDTVSLSGPAHAVAKIQAADWIPVEEARLIINGEIFRRTEIRREDRNTDGLLDVEVRIPLLQEEDYWILLEVGRNPDNILDEDIMLDLDDSYGVYARVMQGQVPLAFSNPIYVDANNDGVWTPPGL